MVFCYTLSLQTYVKEGKKNASGSRQFFPKPHFLDDHTYGCHVRRDDHSAAQAR